MDSSYILNQILKISFTVGHLKYRLQSLYNKNLTDKQSKIVTNTNMKNLFIR